MKVLVASLALIPAIAFAADTELKTKSLDDLLFSADFWEKPLEGIKKDYEPEKTDEDDEGEIKIEAELRKKLKEQGFDIDDYAEEGAFAWLSAQKMGLRAPGGLFTVLDKEIGEVVIRSKGEGPTSVSVSIFNRGDDGMMKKSMFMEVLQEWKIAMDEKLDVRPDSRNKAGAVSVTGWMWKKGGTAFLLEGSVTRSSNRGEFIRMRMAPLNSSGGTARSEVVRRDSLEKNVAKRDNGDVMVQGVPMVDQGDKGYCVVATVERVGRYMGLDVDQHELAQLANTDDAGTNAGDMEKAFKKLTGKIHVRTLRLMDFDDRQFEKDFKSYNRVAKREGVWYDERDFDDWYLDPRWFWMKAHKSTFKEMKAKQNGFDHFNRKIKEYVDQGIPVCWTLYLGMFQEEDAPQSWGGHMRLIIGYNEKSGEIVYTDSWGDGHGMKRMPADEAWCMTMGLYAMVPNR